MKIFTMDNKTCFFIGSRHTPNTIKQQLTNIIEKHITEFGITIFTVRHYGAFDRLVQGVLQEAKNRHADIKLYLLELYALDKKIETPKDFDGTFYHECLEFVPKRFAIAQANRYMIQNSDYLISYCHGVGNSKKLTEYAKKTREKGRN